MKKIIVITGGSDGLGKEIATLLKNDHRIVILSKNKNKTEQVAHELNVESEVCDVGNYSEIKQAVEKILSKFKKIDVLINCAGLYLKGRLEDNDEQQIKQVFAVNTLGVIFSAKAVISSMKKQRQGLIINMITQGGLPGFGKAERSIYYSSKMAITSFTKSISQELLPFGIRVTGMYPGKINTKFMEKQGGRSDMSNAVDAKEVAKIVQTIVLSSENVHIPEKVLRA